MSKRAQRRQTAFNDGKRDGLLGNFFKWKRHPQIRAYHAGFKKGSTIRKNRKVKK